MNKAERVDVLDFNPSPEVFCSRPADRQVDVATEGAFLHVAVRDFRGPEKLAKAFEIVDRLIRTPDVRLRDDLEKRNAGAVQVHMAPVGKARVKVFPGILLEVHAVDPDRPLSRLRPDAKAPPGQKGLGVLGDLVSLRKVRVEIVFSLEGADGGDPASGGKSGPDAKTHRLPVEDRESPGMAETDRTDQRVGGGPETVFATTEELCLSQELGVHLKSHHDFPPSEKRSGRAAHRRPPSR